MAFDLQIATATLYMEASGEPLEGQQGVCAVLVNRLKDGRWGHTLAAVCLAPLQFSSWNSTDPNRKRLALAPDTDPSLIKFESMVQAALSGSSPDPTDNALWYFNPSLAKPFWASSYVLTARLGNQTFYKQSGGTDV